MSLFNQKYATDIYRDITSTTNNPTFLFHYSNPTPETSPLFQNLTWPKVKPDNLRYMDIDKTLIIKSKVKNGRYQQWKQLFEKFAVLPHITF